MGHFCDAEENSFHECDVIASWQVSNPICSIHMIVVQYNSITYIHLGTHFGSPSSATIEYSLNSYFNLVDRETRQL